MVAMRAPGWAAARRASKSRHEPVRRPRRRVAAVEQRVDDDVVRARRVGPARRSRRRGRSIEWTPPGPSRPTRCSRRRGRQRARRRASSAAFAANEPSAIAASMRGRSWSTGRPAPRLRWPTSLLPIWPGGQADRRARRLERRVRPRRRGARASAASAAAAMASAAGRGRRRSHRGRRARVGRGRAPGPGRAQRGRRRPSRRACGGEPGARDDAGHLVDLEARAADQRAVDGRLGEELADRRAGDAAAVEDRQCVRAAVGARRARRGSRGWRRPSPPRRRRARCGRCRSPRPAHRR